MYTVPEDIKRRALRQDLPYIAPAGETGLSPDFAPANATDRSSPETLKAVLAC